MDRFRIQSLAKILKEGILSPWQTAAARQMLEEKALIYIQGAIKRGKEKEANEIRQVLVRRKALDESDLWRRSRS